MENLVQNPIASLLNFQGTLESLGAAPTTNQVLQYNGTKIVGSNLPAFSQLQGGVYKMNLAYGSTTTFTVNTGVVRDSTDTVSLSLSALQTVTITSAGALGNDSFAGSGTVDCAASATVTQHTASTNFLTAFNPRALAGVTPTIGTGNIASTTITGVGTLFLSDCFIGDLIGNASVGYAEITAIASDTSLTVTSNLTIPSSSTGLIIEAPTIKVPSYAALAVIAIASNTSLTCSGVLTAGSVTNQPWTIGLPIINTFGYAFIGNGSGGTTVYVSNCRTVPYGITNYNTYYRRIGFVVYLNNSNNPNILQFTQKGTGNEKRYYWPYINVLSSGTAAVWTKINLNFSGGQPLLPPSATDVFVNVFMLLQGATTAAGIFVSDNNLVTLGGTTPTNGIIQVYSQLMGGAVAGAGQVSCDTQQNIAYYNTVAAQHGFIDVGGCIERLT